MTDYRFEAEAPLERKYCGQGDVLSLKEGHVVEGYASLFGELDRGGDVVAPGAYARSLKALAGTHRRAGYLSC